VAKVTSKLQVTVPKAIAKQYRIEPGDEVLFVASGDAVRMVPAKEQPAAASVTSRLRLFDQATERQLRRELGEPMTAAEEPGWTREELYDRGRPR
jgi:AbrB family looped-hinge helix DNA binding protein